MSYLALTDGSSTTIEVNVTVETPGQRHHDVGALSRAFDGTPLDSRRARWTEWTGILTPPIAREDADALDALLTGEQPLLASGELVDGSSVEVFCTSPEITERVAVGDQEYVVMRFDMWAATN